jgi:hypothetical protein
MGGRPYDPLALAGAARHQVGVTTGYDAAYHTLRYPGGDLPRKTGVCADVVVRAVRDGWGLDLQRLVHEDMSLNFPAYPRLWNLSAPDSNIDHRRVPNLETYWARQGAEVWRAKSHVWGCAFPGPLRVGDLLTWRTLPRGGPHVAIVVAGGAFPRIVQNNGGGAREELLLTMFPHAATALFRWQPRTV